MSFVNERVFAMSRGTGKTTGHYLLRQFLIASAPLFGLYDLAATHGGEIFTESGITEDEIADAVRSVLREVAQILIVVPVDDALGQLQLRVASRHRASKEAAWTLILEPIGNPSDESLIRESRLGRLCVDIDIKLARGERIKRANLQDLSGGLQPAQRPLRTNGVDRAAQCITRISPGTDLQHLPFAAQFPQCAGDRRLRYTDRRAEPRACRRSPREASHDLFGECGIGHRDSIREND